MAVEPARGGLHSSDRLEGYWAGKLGQAPESWAECEETGPRKGALGRERERLGRTGPCGWIRLFRADFQVRLNGSGDKLGRVVSDGLELGRTGWTCVNRRKMGQARERGDERRR
ncbi:hypothetical protein CDL15_Pgr004045 [Punica granatum]|uniref:Uncharacterized protein n=1 Tax=Punica granatum TaxID=22663 RepID=A0A218XFW7_PUNGR|nr:hypothetical protein CDL15_Pgr004045 [Punica granatum]